MQILDRLLKRKPASPFPGELSALAPFAMANRRVLEKLYTLGRDIVARNIPGDFVECGVYNGGSAAAISCAWRGTGRHAWLYDSFQGMPVTTPPDGQLAATYAGAGTPSEQRVHEALATAHLAPSDYTIRKGWFHKTFEEPLPDAVALLHVDCDWHESILLTLETFYDRVSEGGIVILDDFGHWEGAREAFYDFISKRNLRPLVERFGHTQLFWIKGRTHNRDFAGKLSIP